MSLKSSITALLLVFVAGSLAYMAVRELRPGGPEPAPSEPPETEGVDNAASPEPARAVVVYYFHGDKRCATCIKLESYAQEAIETHFAEELGNERLRWNAVNVDEAGNEHFVKDFQLVTKSVVLVEMQDGEPGRWQNLDRVWELVGDKASYTEYIRKGTRDFLGSAS